MCVVSMVIDAGKRPWEDALNPWINPIVPWNPVKTSPTLPQELEDKWKEFKDIIRRLDEIDRVLGQPDCDENKRDWITKIDKRLADIEAKIKKKGIKQMAKSVKAAKAKVKPSTTGKNDGQTKAPKGSTEKLKGGNQKVKRKGQAGH